MEVSEVEVVDFGHLALDVANYLESAASIDVKIPIQPLDDVTESVAFLVCYRETRCIRYHIVPCDV